MIGKKSHMNMTLARRAAECEANEQLRKKWYITVIDMNLRPIHFQWKDWIEQLINMLSFGHSIYWEDVAAKAKQQLVWTKFYNLLP